MFAVLFYIELIIFTLQIYSGWVGLHFLASFFYWKSHQLLALHMNHGGPKFILLHVSLWQRAYLKIN